MKALLIFLTLFGHCLSLQADGVKFGKKRIPSIKLSYQNSVLLEQVIRQNGGRDMKTDTIELKLSCSKSVPVRGRTNVKAYECKPIEANTASER